MHYFFYAFITYALIVYLVDWFITPFAGHWLYWWREDILQEWMIDEVCANLYRLFLVHVIYSFELQSSYTVGYAQIIPLILNDMGINQAQTVQLLYKLLATSRLSTALIRYTLHSIARHARQIYIM